MFYDHIANQLNKEWKDIKDKPENFLQLSAPEYKIKKELKNFLAQNNVPDLSIMPPSIIPIIGLSHKNAEVECLNEAKIFCIDELTLDSLHNVPHNNINYGQSIKLPFRYIFFEFNKPINFYLREGNIPVSGALYYSYADKIQKQHDFVIKNYGFADNYQKREPINFEVKFYSKDPAIKKGKGCEALSILFNILGLPNFKMTVPFSKYYDINYKQNKITAFGLNKDNLEDYGDLKSESIGPNGQEFISEVKKKIDLTLNLINYINAQNVVIKKISRESRSQQDLDRINRKRQRDRKNQISPLKPYYMVEVKKSYVYEDEKGDQGLWSLENRVWVRGHFRHYEDKAPIWIEPFVKGPENAPWKHNRYAVLYKNFKHLLPRRGNEAD